jgi:hypothetical protein
MENCRKIRRDEINIEKSQQKDSTEEVSERGLGVKIQK